MSDISDFLLAKITSERDALRVEVEELRDIAFVAGIGAVRAYTDEMKELKARLALVEPVVEAAKALNAKACERDIRNQWADEEWSELYPEFLASLGTLYTVVDALLAAEKAGDK